MIANISLLIMGLGDKWKIKMISEQRKEPDILQ
jgi:hypothetical protein